MNKILNLFKILRDCPKGMLLWSPFLGEVEFICVKYDVIYKDNIIYVDRDGTKFGFFSDGKYDREGECMLFPSKDQRDWSKFKAPVKRFNPEEFKPFDKVLLCDNEIRAWIPGFFGSLLKDLDGKYAVVELGSGYRWEICIPYNDKTKQLAGTADDCPKFYKWWEK